MEEWKTYHISDIATVITGKTPSTKNPDYYGGSIHFVTPADINKGSKHIIDTDRTISEMGMFSVKGSIIPKGSTCVSCIGNIGYVGMTTMNCISNQQINTVIPKSNCDKDFLYYLMRSLWPVFKNYEGQSTTLSILNKSQFSKIPVKLPSLQIQRKIASVLSSIDNKIELNNQINHNLEEQAQALYKSWFVDFEPFKDGEFVDSELGMIPVGWKIGQLSDISEIVGGATPSKARSEYYTNKGIAWLTPKDLSISSRKFTARGSEDITKDGYDSCSAKLMPRGSVLFSSRAPIGYITIAKNEICTNQGFKSLVPQKAGTSFLYYYLKDNLEMIESKASGSTFKEVSGSLMKSFPVIIPCENIFEAFESNMSGILNEQEMLEAQNEQLISLRDSLLPKLMSGELSVNSID